jgi:hypothetical protein
MIAKSSFPDGANDVTHSRKGEKVTVVVPGVENGIKTLGVFFPSSSESFGILEAKIFTAEVAEKCRRERKEISSRGWHAQRALPNFFALSAQEVRLLTGFPH